MKHIITLLFLLGLNTGFFAQKQNPPCEAGEEGIFQNTTTGQHYTYKITRNDPYALPRYGLDLKAQFDFSRFTACDIGLYQFFRPNRDNEFRIGAIFILGNLNDTVRSPQSTIIAYNNYMYSLDLHYCWFFYHHIRKKLDDEIQKQVDTKRNPNKRINNSCFVKHLIQYGLAVGAQGFYGNTGSYVKPTLTSDLPLTYSFPYESVVLSLGLEQRNSSCFGYQIKGRAAEEDHIFWLSGFYLRFLYAPLLTNQYINADQHVQERFSAPSDHMGFALGGYFDMDRIIYQATVETGIMPGMGWYFKLGFPLTEYGLYRSKKNIRRPLLKGKGMDGF